MAIKLVINKPKTTVAYVPDAQTLPARHRLVSGSPNPLLRWTICIYPDEVQLLMILLIGMETLMLLLDKIKKYWELVKCWELDNHTPSASLMPIIRDLSIAVNRNTNAIRNYYIIEAKHFQSHYWNLIYIRLLLLKHTKNKKKIISKTTTCCRGD